MAAPRTDEDKMAEDKMADPLFLATFDGNLELLKNLAAELNCGETLAETFLRVTDSRKLNTLHIAAAAGKTQICKYLIQELKLDVNLEDQIGNTPLHQATIEGKYPTFVYLLNNGANPTLANRKDLSTPLHYAAQKGCKEFVKLLIEKGAKIEEKALAGTPLHIAAANGKKDALNVLLKHKADPNAFADPYFTPVISAVLANSFDCVEMLLKAGANANFESHGVTPLKCAATKGNTEIIKYLLKYGANANVTDLSGITPLEISALTGDREVCKILFPVTNQISYVKDWTVMGVLEYVRSEEAHHRREVKREENFVRSKSRGESSFKKEDYLDAIFWYTEALEAKPSSAAILSNRSMCWARLKEGARALLDASACIEAQSDWPKAYYRTGVALTLLKRYDLASRAFSSAKRLDPDNKEIEAALRKSVQLEFGDSFRFMHFFPKS